MASTEILPWAIGPGANVENQAAYAVDPNLVNGYQYLAELPSNTLNKNLRQSSFIAAGWANWCVSQGVSVPDDGNLPGLVANLNTALTNFFSSAPIPGTFTTLTVSGTVSGAGFIAYLASPPPIGNTTPNSGAFTNLSGQNLSVANTVSGTGFVNYFASPPPLGSTIPNTGAFTNVTINGTLKDSLASVGTNGQFLTSTGTGTKWVNAPQVNYATTVTGNTSLAAAITAAGATTDLVGNTYAFYNSTGASVTLTTTTVTNTASFPSNSTANSIIIPAGATVVVETATAGSVYNVVSASTAAVTTTIVDDSASNLTEYVTFARATSGNLSTIYTASADATFNPSTGLLAAPSLAATTLTSTQVLFASPSGVLLGDTDMTFDGTSLTLANVLNAPSVNGATTLELQTGGTTALTVDASQNVGIGTTTPTNIFEVQTNGGAVNAASFFSPSTTNGATINLADNYNSVQIKSVPVTASTSSDMAFFTAATQRMRLDSSGNLGLGVTPSAWSSPVRALDIGSYTSLVFDGVQSTYLANNAVYNGGWKYKNNAYANSYDLSATTGEHIWYTAPSGTAGNPITFTQAMTLDANGALMIGDTSPIAGQGAIFNVNQTAATFAGFIKCSGGSTGFGVTNGGGTASYSAMAFFNNGNALSTCGSISIAGSSTSYLTASDQRLKENIVDAPRALDSVNAIKVRSFDWKSDGSHVDYGYIAQELLEVAPEAVNVPSDESEMMGVDFGKLTPRLVKAIQEQQSIIDDLTARIAKLEKK